MKLAGACTGARGEESKKNNARARTDITVGKMSQSKGVMCEGAEIMERPLEGWEII